jgi:hypothetical protein
MEGSLHFTYNVIFLKVYTDPNNLFAMRHQFDFTPRIGPKVSFACSLLFCHVGFSDYGATAVNSICI